MTRAPIAILMLAFVGCAASPAVERAPAPSADATPLERKLIQNPNDPGTNLALGEDAESHGDLLRAEQYYLRAEALGVAPEKVVPRIVRVLTGAQRYDEALDRCQRRLADAPGDRPTRFVEAALYAALERTRDAERDLAALIADRPKDPAAYLALGRLYRDSRDPERAKQMFHKYLELAPQGAEAASVRFDLAEEGELPPMGAEP